MLPDEVLLRIFDFYVDGCHIMYDFRYWEKQPIEGWITLAHVCRRWRDVIFQSPLRLKLRLVCTPGTPTREFLDIWPPFPLIIRDFVDEQFSADDMIAAFEHNDRVCQINLTSLTSSHVTDLVFQKPFPRLTEDRKSVV